METAKRLFAERGFGATSVSDIAGAADIPVGSIYTYFSSKEDLIRAIVEEGWADLKQRIESAFSAAPDSEARLRVLVDKFLPELLTDVDFIQILLTEGVAYTRIEEKTAELTSLISGVLGPLLPDADGVTNFSKEDMKAALFVYFLGVLGAVRLGKTTDLEITSADLLAFLRKSIQSGLGVAL